SALLPQFRQGPGGRVRHLFAAVRRSRYGDGRGARRRTIPRGVAPSVVAPLGTRFGQGQGRGSPPHSETGREALPLIPLSPAIFDIETRIDKRLVNETQFRGGGLSDEAAFAKLRDELLDTRGNDFFPLSFHIPVSIAVGTVSGDY